MIEPLWIRAMAQRQADQIRSGHHSAGGRIGGLSRTHPAPKPGDIFGCRRVVEFMAGRDANVRLVCMRTGVESVASEHNLRKAKRCLACVRMG
jgi:hypothetical protein